MMNDKEKKHHLLRLLPGVDSILECLKTDAYFSQIPRSVRTQAIRSALDELRQKILDGDVYINENEVSEPHVIERARTNAQIAMRPNLRRVINATGVIVHTNLGRSLLAQNALENIVEIASRYSNLEFDLHTGTRGSRYSNVEALLCEISGAESAMVVNNNAGAVLLCLETLAKRKNVIVSRGELVEIGGSFRIPDVMLKSGCTLKEIGTTNRTHFRDYEMAIDVDTALLLKVHTSNYSVVGFTASVPLKQLAELGKSHNIPVMEDLGSGTFIDFSKYGMIKEPTVQESVAAGVDVVTFSGDKLLGGPQAGIILGKRDIVSKIKQNPLTRALRIDKLTLAALEATLRLYRDPDFAVRSIPTLNMLTCPIEDIQKKADGLADMLKNIDPDRIQIKCMNTVSRVGGGALPLQELPSKCVGIYVKGMSANSLEKYLRAYAPPIIGRIEEDWLIIDLRTVHRDEFEIIQSAFSCLSKENG